VGWLLNLGLINKHSEQKNDNLLLMLYCCDIIIPNIITWSEDYDGGTKRD